MTGRLPVADPLGLEGRGRRSEHRQGAGSARIFARRAPALVTLCGHSPHMLAGVRHGRGDVNTGPGAPRILPATLWFRFCN